MVVTCAPIADDAVYVTEPRLIVEVLSESTAARDRLEKWIAYRGLDGLQEYVLVSQETPGVDVYRRAADGWRESHFTPDEDLELVSMDLRIALSDIIYAG